jgi:hypothetical protein
MLLLNFLNYVSYIQVAHSIKYEVWWRSEGDLHLTYHVTILSPRGNFKLKSIILCTWIQFRRTEDKINNRNMTRVMMEGNFLFLEKKKDRSAIEVEIEMNLHTSSLS